MTTKASLHPRAERGFKPAAPDFQGGTLVCQCPADKVAVTIASQCAHNHLCGCSQCWKPEGASFSLVAVVPRDKVKVTANEQKLDVVNPAATIKRFACKACGVHMYGRIDNDKHPFFGLDFIHPELSAEEGWAPPEFAAFVSSVIETGTPPGDMAGIRSQLKAMGLEPYDCLSPPLMDAIATHTAKARGTLAA